MAVPHDHRPALGEEVLGDMVVSKLLQGTRRHMQFLWAKRALHLPNTHSRWLLGATKICLMQELLRDEDLKHRKKVEGIKPHGLLST